ncbi:MAG: aldehyde dehydrogenase [Actinomycetota bacterium]|nr:aldehyde dehydrogenase [Actinomycetota bacterium]
MALVAGAQVDTDHFIGGRRMASESTFEDISPIDARVIAEVARGGQHEAYLAIGAAKAAFEVWRRVSPKERAAYLHRIADLVEERVEVLAAVETADNGALLRSHRRSVMPRVAQNFRFFADYLTDSLEVGEFHTRGHRNHVSYDPAGVAVLISPWNAPLMLATWKVAPALAAGDTVVLKPSEWSPLTASLLADIVTEAGLPPGVFNVVQGFGEEAGAALVADSRVRRISFTGSVPTARLIAAACAKNLTPVSFELGGKSPFMVFDDADLELAVSMAVEQYDNAGQVCLSGTRLLVQSGIWDAFMERFVAAATSLRQGDPREEETQIGPQIHPEHLARIDGFVSRAKASGAKVAFGGGPNQELGGLYYRPTLFVEVDPQAEIAREEVFGPVLVALRFDTEAEAVALANDTDFGLAAMVFTSDPERAERVSAEVVAGTVWNNCFYVRDLRAPFGGSKRSGVGREGGAWSFDFFCDLKNSVFSPHGWRV